MSEEKKSKTLRALTASAFALPGLPAAANAAAPIEETAIDGQFSYYEEDNLRKKKTVPTSERDRMEIYTYQFRVQTPTGDRTDVAAEFGYERMSGASPWYVLPGIPGRPRPIQVMSGSTIDDQRGDLLLTGNYYYDWGKVSGSIGTSIEEDYYSFNFGGGGEREFNDKNTVLSGGTTLSFDWVRPTESGKFSKRPEEEEKQTFRFYAGLTQVLTRHSTFQTTLSYEHSRDYLSDPYKEVFIINDGVTVADNRPDERNSFTWLNRYRHHFSAWGSTLHADYKLYVDDWGINSHTIDLAWYQDVFWPNLKLIPSFRYYTQSEADFYDLFFDDLPADGEVTSDYRLSPYGAISYRIKAQLELEDWLWDCDWIASASWERYKSSGSYAIHSVGTEAPGLVSFNLFSARIGVRF